MKEYLLLRNNRESGPYSLEELKQMGLKAYDLVWVENRSYSWKYPSEISELALFAPPLEVSVSDKNNEGDLPNGWGEVQRGATSGEVWPLNAEERIPVPAEAQRYPGHVVTFRPRIENLRIKTIKSTAQPRVVKVEVREMPPFEEPAMNIAGTDTDALTVLPTPRYNRPLTTVKQLEFERLRKFNFLDSLKALNENNSMEMIVLAVGVASLLALAYLLITAGY